MSGRKREAGGENYEREKGRAKRRDGGVERESERERKREAGGENCEREKGESKADR